MVCLHGKVFFFLACPQALSEGGPSSCHFILPSLVIWRVHFRIFNDTRTQVELFDHPS